MPAPKGNDNAAKGREWRQAIQRALSRRSEKDYRAGLDLVADKLVDAACNGDRWAIEEIGNRADGKPSQSIDANLSGEVSTRLIING